MPRTAKKTSPRKSSKRAARPRAGGAVETAFRSASRTAESRVKELIESGRPALAKAQGFVSKTGKNLSKQTEALRSDLAHRVAELGARVDKERKSFGKKVDGAVKTTLASLNIPTRSEINLLARRVEELSKKIDGLKSR